MRTVEIPEDRFASFGLTFEVPEGSPVAVFTYPKANPDDPKEKAVIVQVSTDGAKLFFFPQRSAAQAKLLAKLGYGTA